MLKRMTCLLFASIVLSHGTIAFSTDLPDYFPGSYEYFGTLQKLDIARNEAVISDMRVKLVQPLHVYTTATKFGTIQTLKVGMKVGANDGGSGTISEIWVLPKDALPFPLPK